MKAKIKCGNSYIGPNAIRLSAYFLPCRFFPLFGNCLGEWSQHNGFVISELGTSCPNFCCLDNISNSSAGTKKFTPSFAHGAAQRQKANYNYSDL